jgi:hypothetical protein
VGAVTEPIHFLVEQAGCESCPAPVNEALGDLFANAVPTVGLGR